MSNQLHSPAPPTESTYIAHLWEYPQLTIAIFGMQAHTPEAYAMYEAAGIREQMEAAVRQAEGFLCARICSEQADELHLHYWRSHDDLLRFAHQMPHTIWWKWLINNRGKGFSFYHEIYQCKTAEALFEIGTRPVGPATFCTTSAVASGEGRSQERQRLFAETAQATPS